MDLNNPHTSIGAEGRRVREQFRKLKPKVAHLTPKRQLSKTGGPAPPEIQAIPSPEHYHLTYTVDGLEVPHFAQQFHRQRAAYLEVARLAQASEPNTEYYEDGRVMIETRLHGRTGRYRVLVGVAACFSRKCRLRGTGLILPTEVLV